MDLADFVATKYWSPKKLFQKFREFRETGVQKWNLKNPFLKTLARITNPKIEQESDVIWTKLEPRILTWRFHGKKPKIWTWQVSKIKIYCAHCDLRPCLSLEREEDLLSICTICRSVNNNWDWLNIFQVPKCQKFCQILILQMINSTQLICKVTMN